MEASFHTKFGVVTIEDGVVVHRLRVGAIRKRDLVHRYDIAKLVAMRRFRDAGGLSVTLFEADSVVGTTLTGCETVADIEAFTRSLVALNPAIEVNRSFTDTALSRDAYASATQARSAPEIEVKRYKDAKDYERDARRMVAAGWHMEGQSGQRGKVNMGRTVLKAGVFLPWVMMRPSRKGDPITVTWLRGGGLVEVESVPAQAPPAPPSPASDDIPTQIRKLAELRDAGIVTDDEFASKKADLLARM